MKRAPWRPFAAVVILILTAVAFIYYFATHPSVGQQLQNMSFGLLILLLVLYMGTLLALTLNTIFSLRVCHLRLGKSESLLLTSYTAVVNFFGPLQSGPAFRAVYLKKKHGMKLKDYTLVTLLYLAFWGLFSGLLLLSGILHWWTIQLGLIILVVLFVIARSRPFTNRLQHLDLGSAVALAGATLLQVAIVSLIYYAELRSVAPQTQFSQALIYTGAANLALYVSLTPGAIGFREAFLVFSQHLHHISDSTIVAASVIDRAVYVIFLLILTAVIFGTHASRRLQKGLTTD